MDWVIGLIILDATLPDPVKQKVNDAHIRAWNALDELKGRMRSDWLFKPSNRRWFALIAVALTMTWYVVELFAYGELDKRGWLNIPLYLMPIPLGIAYGYAILWFVLRGGILSGFLRAVLTFAVLFVLMFVIGSLWFFSDEPEPDFENLSTLWRSNKDYVVAQFLFYVQFTGSMFFWAAVIPLLAVMIAQFAVAISEFIIRRVAESRDGAVAGWARFFEILKGG